jgi:hypothetical protein
MAAPYVTGPEITAAVGNASPSAADIAWAAKCAAAIEAIITDRLDGATPSADLEARLHVAAELDGAALYLTRDAPQGVYNVGVDGTAIRIGSSQSRALDNVFLPGIA